MMVLSYYLHIIVHFCMSLSQDVKKINLKKTLGKLFFLADKKHTSGPFGGRQFSGVPYSKEWGGEKKRFCISGGAYIPRGHYGPRRASRNILVGFT